MDYLKELDKLTKKLQDKYSAGTIMNFRTGDKLPEVERVQLENPLLGKLFGGGGVPIGRAIEIYGSESSGKTSICEYIAGQYQKSDFINENYETGEVETDKDGNPITHKGTVLYIDTEHSLDPEFAKKHGMDIDKIILSQPDSGEDALDIAIAYIESGLVDLVVLDSIAATTPIAEIEGTMSDAQIGLQARMFSKFFRKVTALLKKRRTTLLCINQTRVAIGQWAPTGQVPTDTSGGKSIKFFTSVRIEIKRKEFIYDKESKDKDVPVGIVIGAKCIKNKTAAPGVKCLLTMMYDTSFDSTNDWLTIAFDLGIIEMAGAGWALVPTLSGEKIRMQGKPKVIDYLTQPENKPLYDDIVSKCKEIMYNKQPSRIAVETEQDEDGFDPVQVDDENESETEE